MKYNSFSKPLRPGGGSILMDTDLLVCLITHVLTLTFISLNHSARLFNLILIKTYLFKVHCKASYLNLYESLSTAHSRWNPSDFLNEVWGEREARPILKCWALSKEASGTIFSSPEHKVLRVSYCDRSLSVVRRPSCIVRRPSCVGHGVKK